MVLSFGGSWEYFLKYSLSSAKSLNLRSILVLDMAGEVREREGCLDKRRVWRINKGGEFKKKTLRAPCKFCCRSSATFSYTKERRPEKSFFKKKKSIEKVFVKQEQDSHHEVTDVDFR